MGSNLNIYYQNLKLITFLSPKELISPAFQNPSGAKHRDTPTVSGEEGWKKPKATSSERPAELSPASAHTSKRKKVIIQSLHKWM